ncbi:MAG: hypothetical protein A3I29_02170 [Candidatus Magasanikbacteria bacterium RIFCSPLOWO2_02_FULL_44_11]|uniref:Uncharacterized protein n=2 Tax=Candidatus Magasanikiibacteriota TaxID=1752731 RepID=A0A1F6NAZ5_9BACT|nr:MAG: hypothetical protein A3D53_01555 [Candidatus Magasanikbacteria bacterium RIFCSPHIGHO2_02_FULL_45_10]OGH81095.1 MAG: hypothetical protein A3I29_02170 [Candidatus Magasanikbacteria bacterium RIFCSPLOWO2_02_FULL_44_11]
MERRPDATARIDADEYKNYRTYADVLADELHWDAAEKEIHKTSPAEFSNLDSLIASIKKIIKSRGNRDTGPKEIRLWLAYAKTTTNFTDLLQLLEHPKNKSDQVSERIISLRILWKDALKKAGLKSDESIIKDQKDLFKTIAELRGGKKLNHQFDSLVTATPDRSTAKPLELYHLTPRPLVESVLKQGLIPGFLTGLTDKLYIYADVDGPNQEFLQPGGLSYNRGGEKHTDFSLMKIIYTPDMQAYMWLDYYRTSKDSQYKSKEVISAFPTKLVSSNCIPLAQQIANKKIAHDQMKFKDNFEFSEVLLDYVPPEKITLIS